MPSISNISVAHLHNVPGSSIPLGQNIVKSLTETVAVSEGLTVSVKRARARTETVVISENMIRQALKKRNLGVGSYTALSYTRLSYTVSDEDILVSDAVTATKTQRRSATENVTVGAGTTSRIKLAKRTIAAETSSISASLARIRIVPRSLTESKTVGDSIARAKKAVRSLTETKSVSESLARVKKAIRSISETKTVGETLARVRQAIRSITETSAVSSSIARVKTAVRSIATESNSVSDSIARIKKAVRTVYGVTQGNPYALSFVSSSSQYVDLTSNSALAVGETAGSEMSYSVWFRATAHPADPIKGIIMTKGLEGSVIFIDHTTGKLNAQFFYNTNFDVYTAQSSADICDSNWHHVVITNSDITHLSKVYLDGTEIGSNNANNTDTTLLTSQAPDYPLTVGLYVEVAGGPPYTLHYPFDGQIDDPRVYNIELTPTEVSNLNAGQNVTRGIVGAWNFNEGTGTTAADSTSNHFDGTLTNSPTWYNTPTLPAIGGAGTIAISDSVARIKKAMRSIAAETNAISDSVSAVKSGAHLFTRSITETVTASSSVARIKIAIRAITETKSIAESLARAKISIRSLTETNAASSSVARIRIVVRSITETKAVSDAIARIKVAIRSITETKPISENLARVRLVTRSITETKTVSDSIARIKKSIRSLTETTSISESLARIKHAIRSITETKTIGDSITRTKIVVRTLVETKSISETLARAKLSIRAITETKTISESLTRVKIAIRTIAETKTITDSVSAIKSGGGFFSRSITETVTSSDSISRVKKSVRAITTESSSISENLTRVKVAIRSITETKTISSSVARIRTVPRLIIETKTVGDSVARAKKSVRSLTESNSISSIVVRSSHRIRSLTESVTVGSGAVARLKKSIRVMTESISISESSSRMKKAIRVAIETSNISSSVTGSKLAKFITRAITESVTIAPGTVTKRTPLAVRMLSELVEVFETIRVMGGVPTVDKTIGTRGMTWVWVQRPPNEPQPRPLFAVVNKASASVNINPLRIMGNSALGLIRIDKTKMLAASTISLVASSGVMKGALRLRAISHAAKCSEIRLDKLPSMATAKSKVVDPIKQSRLLKLLRISSLIEMLEKL